MPIYCSQGHKNDPNHRFCQDCGQLLPLAVGEILEKRYRIVSHLGQGGFGRTYLAEALHRFNERCVLKEFAPQVQSVPELQKAKELFGREAGALHKLKHPQLPGFLELFQADMGTGVGCLFIVQDYVEGPTYFDLFKSGKPLSEAEVVQFLYQLLPLLSYIHSKGVIHRDITPDNIILRNSDKLPVLIDFGGVKQLAATAVLKFTNIGGLETRLGKKGYAPEEQLRTGQVFANSDLYSLAVTALVLLTGKEPQKLYDSHKGAWLWGQEIRTSSQLQAILQKMLAHKVSDRFSSADEVLKTLQSQLPQPNSNVSQVQTNVIHPNTRPIPVLLSAIASNTTSKLRTLVFAPAKPAPAAIALANPTPNPIAANANNPVIPKPPQFVGKLGLMMLKLSAGLGLILVTGYAGWAVMSSVIHSIHLPSLGQLPRITAPSKAPSASDSTKTNNIWSRRKNLGITAGFFNTLVNESFYANHPELNRRPLTSSSKDAALRQQWQKNALDLLDKLEKAQLSAAARQKLGGYVQRDYKIWQRQANRGQLGGYTIDQLSKQTDAKFYKLFPQQQGEKLDLETFGQIWYAIFSDQVSQLETGQKK
ncbi:MAG TPA: serine/threonine protein kinase [Cyanobacteria bacterium UBA8553]|nr:serine/threonine protein kinase [Cyanobacteria bacterium UBA8553]